MSAMYVLHEAASGYGLFEVQEAEGINLTSSEIQQSIKKLDHFGKICKLKSFIPFTSAKDALENINCISEGIVHDTLKSFLETYMPKSKGDKKSKVMLGVADSYFCSAINDTLNIRCESGEIVHEVIRGIRLHFPKFVKALREGDLEKAQLGLGHGYSRAKVKFNVNRVDNMVTNAIALLDQVDKDLNTFAMRAKEWYGYHFPELVRYAPDNYNYARVATIIGNRAECDFESVLDKIEPIIDDTAKAQQIIHAAKMSMGLEISEFDCLNVNKFLERVISLSEYRLRLSTYLKDKMHMVAPNLSELIGETVGARLISQAGSLTNLAKYPASTVQILGAEKALFRALKTKGNTPKYGLIYHSSFIGRASQKNKGRISRYLANKCSQASRIDCFIEQPTGAFGKALNAQVEERLNFYQTGAAPRKNIDVMKGVISEAGVDMGDIDVEDSKVVTVTSSNSSEEKKSKKSKKNKRTADEVEEEDGSSAAKVKESKKSKKSKKAKKSKK